MRLMTIGVLAAALSVSACRGADTASAAGTPAGAAPAADVNRDPSSAPVATAEKTEPVRPVVREITIPSGTALSIALDTSVGSATSRVEQPVRAHLTRPTGAYRIAVTSTKRWLKNPRRPPCRPPRALVPRRARDDAVRHRRGAASMSLPHTSLSWPKPRTRR